MDKKINEINEKCRLNNMERFSNSIARAFSDRYNSCVKYDNKTKKKICFNLIFFGF